jgi:peptidoglycan-N-acetylglucosamine deacetylase
LVSLVVGVLLASSAALASAPAARVPFRRARTTEPVVALTFDACATRTHGYGFDRAVYEALKKESVPLTVFVSGEWIEHHQAETAELARDPLVTFGDHSFDHPHMAKLSTARMGDEIDRTEAALAPYGRKSVAFRPPFGQWSRRLVAAARARGLPTVTWDVVSGDPSKHTTEARLVHNVVTRARPGSIVIFHINGRGRHTAEALPTILHDLRQRGLRFVSLPDLLAFAPPI